MQTLLRPWSTESSERKWAISVACVCLIILIFLPFWPAKKKIFDEKKLAETNIATQQAIAVNTVKKAPAKPTLKPVISYAKQANKKIIITEKYHSIPIQTTKKSSPSIASQAYFIQAGAFRDKNHAKKLQKQLTQKHWPVIIQKKKHLYAVQIGPYKNKEKANSIKKQLSYKAHIDGFITHHAYP